MSEISENINKIKETIREAAEMDGRATKDVCLIAVSKRQTEARLQAALDAGHRVFGENKVQEAEGHWQDKKATFPEFELHLIGSLQSNKVAQAVSLFDAIHTVDREKLIPLLAEEMQKQQKKVTCFIQVNTGAEPQKSGVLVSDLPNLLQCAKEHGLEISGLMCLPPKDENPAMHFGLLRTLADKYGLPCLSMGMSNDYETAIRFGATHIRVGTSLFGERDI